MSKALPSGWIVSGKKLQKSFKFDTFSDAISYMVAVSFFCQEKDHHPEWSNVYNKINVELTTHDKGDITDKDIDLANHMDEKFIKFK